MALIVSSFRIRSWVQSVLCHIAEAIDFAGTHPTRVLRQRAAAETADYIRDHMPKALSLYTSMDLLNYCLKQIKGTPGIILELGVFKGGSIRHIAKQCPEREIHGFDSFEGLPEAWPESGHDKGSFSADGQLPTVPDNVKLHKGYFDVTLPAWLKQNDKPIAFIHIDCDLYSSTKTIFDLLGDRIKPGMIIAFDDYFNFPRWQQGEHLAFTQFIQQHDRKYEYICHARCQVAVRILD